MSSYNSSACNLIKENKVDCDFKNSSNKVRYSKDLFLTACIWPLNSFWISIIFKLFCIAIISYFLAGREELIPLKNSSPDSQKFHDPCFLEFQYFFPNCNPCLERHYDMFQAFLADGDCVSPCYKPSEQYLFPSMKMLTVAINFIGFLLLIKKDNAQSFYPSQYSWSYTCSGRKL